MFIGGNRNDDSQARGQAGLAIRGEQSQAGSQAESYGAARKKKKKKKEKKKKQVRESGSQGQPGTTFWGESQEQPFGEPTKRTQPFGKPAFGEATFWGIEEPTFLKVELEAC